MRLYFEYFKSKQIAHQKIDTNCLQLMVLLMNVPCQLVESAASPRMSVDRVLGQGCPHLEFIF